MNNEGNRNTTSDLVGSFKALKENIMRTLNVCEIGTIEREAENNYYKVKLLNKPNVMIECFSRDEYNLHDLVLIIFTDYDSRANLIRVLSNQDSQEVKKESTKHDLDFGIIIKAI